MSTYEGIYQLTRQIPLGFVATYGDIAKAAGTSPRVVGNALHVNPDAPQTPCHRVVNAQGQLAEHFGIGGIDEQRKRLTAEGVVVTDYRVDLTQYRFIFES